MKSVRPSCLDFASIHRRLPAAFACALLCIAGPGLLRAQSDATVAGTVVDQTGKVIPNAAVSVKNESTGVVSKTTTTPDGRFTTGVAARK